MDNNTHTPHNAPVWRYDHDTMVRYAEVLLWALTMSRSAPLKKSDLVLVHYDVEALPLAEYVVAALHERGHVPVPRAEPSPRMRHDFLQQANNKRLTMEIPGDRELLQSIAGAIRLIAPSDPRHLKDLDPELMNIAERGKKPLQDVLYRREQSGFFGWTVGIYPSSGGALAANMSMEAYARQVEKACMINTAEPVNAWRKLYRELREVTRALDELHIGALRVRSESMDLLLPVGARRKWLAITGRNVPSYEVYTSPDWRGAEGEFYADVPAYRYGRRISGMRLTFRFGEAVYIDAHEGAQFALQQVRMDPGANKIGEFSLVDKRFSRVDRYMGAPLFDENLGGEHGSCHIALGQAYPSAYAGLEPLSNQLAQDLGFNNSALHWDLVNSEDKEVYALLEDGGKELVYAKGRFTVA